MPIPFRQFVGGSLTLPYNIFRNGVLSSDPGGSADLLDGLCAAAVGCTGAFFQGQVLGQGVQEAAHEAVTGSGGVHHRHSGLRGHPEGPLPVGDVATLGAAFDDDGAHACRQQIRRRPTW